jgi:hypothetical protein
MKKNDELNFDVSNVITMTDGIMSDISYFVEGILKARFDKGHEKMLVITGENATGKSFMRRLYHIVCKKEKIEFIHISQESRVDGGVMSAFVYGSENWESTGYISSKTILNGISTCQSRDNDHFILWDEPDIGLSEKYAGAAGVAIKKYVENISNYTRGCIVITHSKPLVKQLLPLHPSYLRLGDNLCLNDWINKDQEPGDLKELGENNIKMFKSISSIMKRISND